MTELATLSQAGAKALALYTAWKTVGLNKDNSEDDDYKPYHATEADREAAELASKHSESMLRGAAVMAALVERSKMVPKAHPNKPKRTPKKRA